MDPSDRRRKLVVAGLITSPRGVLLTLRREDQPLPLFWEFPGGKVEPGESPADALRRELAEELGVEVEVGRIWDVLFHAYPEFDVVLLVYQARIVAGEPRPVEVKEVRWVAAGELAALRILPADEALVTRLVNEGLPK